jgi:hypothetical protein
VLLPGSVLLAVLVSSKIPTVIILASGGEMADSLPSGIRFIGDAIDEDIARSVELMCSICRHNGFRFFFDTSDCDIYNVGGKRLNDLYGWIVPESEADDFEKKWRDKADWKDPDLGEQWYQAIVWEDYRGVATPVILGDDGDWPMPTE